MIFSEEFPQSKLSEHGAAAEKVPEYYLLAFSDVH
jgi:hypothetical protein